MLLKSQITSFESNSEEWYQARKGKITSSKCSLLISESKFTKGALTYLRNKAGEILTGIPIRDDILTEATAHGNTYQPEAIRKYISDNKIEKPVISEKAILDTTGTFLSTPDFIILLEASIKVNDAYYVETGEVKCPPTYARFIELSECENAQDLERIEKEYFWQTIDQMLVCDAVAGNFIVYHPYFGDNALHHLKFNKKDPFIQSSLNALKIAKDKAEEQKNKIIEKLKSRIK